MKRRTLVCLLLLVCAAAVPVARLWAFCGFYVGRADARLFNHASQVVLVRDGDRTVLTMASDYQGSLTEFALVVPVPTFLRREQIHVADSKLVDHLDAYTAPRLVEYFDENPCQEREYFADRMMEGAPAAKAAPSPQRAASLGVTIEASYTVGEYDILILSAEQSDGLTTWLRENGYRIPNGAEPVVASYLRQGMRFFVAKVNLEEQARLGYSNLRPLQVAYETPKFMLPIRLGTVNADGAQELFVYALTRRGRVETTNYRTVRLPTGMDIPVYVKDDFPHFYRDMFGHQVQQEDMRAVFLEYAWDMAWCDPCAAEPLSAQELRELGVFWLDGNVSDSSPAQDVFVSRLHLRYDRDHFPEDLLFQQTGDRENFQGRYVLRQPWTGPATCPAARTYYQQLADRRERESQTLASLTGWDVNDIRQRQGKLPGAEPPPPPPESKEPWWKRLWGGL